MSPSLAITGAAGLVGQNLIPRLKAHGYADIVAIDKHAANTAILRRLHPDITVIEANLAHDDGWQEAVAACDVSVCAHAQIGGIDRTAYMANNVLATKRLIEAVKANPKAYIVHISSSVVNRRRPTGTPKLRKRRKSSSSGQLFLALYYVRR